MKFLGSYIHVEQRAAEKQDNVVCKLFEDIILVFVNMKMFSDVLMSKDVHFKPKMMGVLIRR